VPFKTPTSAVFLQNFRGWNRVEPRSRADDFAKGLETGVADPLWMLGRQWQTAELKGEDAGTPISVSLDHETVTLTHIKLGETSVPTELDFVPPEVLVEREAVPWDWRLRLRVGQHFERLLRLKYPGSAQAFIDRARELYSITAPEPPSQDWLETDYASLRFALLLDGRAIDGMVLMEKARSGELQLIAPGGVVDDLIAWFDKLFSQPPAGTSTAWRPERLDYRFELGASASPSGQELVADSCRNGSIDWHTFSQADTRFVPRYAKPTLVAIRGRRGYLLRPRCCEDRPSEARSPRVCTGLRG
jgi:hypothetical protein